jgi:hypothetical protein
MGLAPMTRSEMQETNGGIFGLVLALVFAIGYFVGWMTEVEKQIETN